MENTTLLTIVALLLTGLLLGAGVFSSTHTTSSYFTAQAANY